MAHLDGEAMGHQLYRASRLYFTRLAQEKPLVVAFEDVHWLDASSAALLEHLLPLIDELPLLVCCVARPEPDTALTQIEQLARTAYAERATEIALQPLSTAQSETLVHNLVDLDDLPPGLRDLILAKAEGNPFFVEEIVRSLIDLGGLVRDRSTNSYRVTERATTINLPDTLVGVIMARVDRLDEDLKQVLRLASVIGRSFFYRLLAAISEAERELDESLAGLQARELVLERARDPELEYVFKHALVQEATYESILKQRRRELHGKVARFDRARCSRTDSRTSPAFSPTTTRRPRTGRRPRSTSSRPATRPGASPPTPRRWSTTSRRWQPTLRPSATRGTRWSGRALERKMGEALYRRGEQERALRVPRPGACDAGQPLPASPGAMRRAIVGQLVRQLGHRLLPWFQPRADDARCGRARRGALPRVLHARVDQHVRRRQRLAARCPALPERGRARGTRVGGIRGSLRDGDARSHDAESRRLFRAYIRRARALAEQGGWDYQLAQAALVTGMCAYWIEGDFAAALRVLPAVRLTCIASWARHACGPPRWGWRPTCRPREASWLKLSRCPGR